MFLISITIRLHFVFLCLALLKIQPATNNGTMGSLNSLLVPEARSSVPKSQGDGTVFRTDICKFPNDTVFDFRSKNDVCASCNVSSLFTVLQLYITGNY